jgi:hypothetical protein
MKYMLAFVIGHCCQLQSSPLPSLFNGSSISAAAGIDILESRVGCTVIVPEFQRRPGNYTLLGVILFLETRRNHKGPNQANKEDGRPQTCCLLAKTLLHCQNSVCQHIVIVNECVLVTPLFWIFSVDSLPQTLQNLPVLRLVNRFTWRNKFLLNNAHSVTKDNNILLIFSITCLLSLGVGEDGLFH